MLGFGYQGIALSDLVDRLVADEVEVLVDVRLNAISRKAGFSKRALSGALETAGIRYVHDPRLGNPRENRAGYADLTSNEGTDARQHYRELLQGPDAVAGLRELKDLAVGSTVAVFCYEADERYCHRQQVLEAVGDVSLVGV